MEEFSTFPLEFDLVLPPWLPPRSSSLLSPLGLFGSLPPPLALLLLVFFTSWAPIGVSPEGAGAGATEGGAGTGSCLVDATRKE